MFGFDVPVVCHPEEGEYLRRLLSLVRNFGITSEYRGLDISCLEDPIDMFYLVKETRVWWCGFEFDDWHRHHARYPYFFGWNVSVSFALPPSERYDIYSPV